jgi:hypothetical protein
MGYIRAGHRLPIVAQRPYWEAAGKGINTLAMTSGRTQIVPA